MPSTSQAKAPQTINFDVTTTVPLLLLPVRLETRFRKNESDPSKYQLLIRVYPDAVHVDSFEPRLTEVEIEWRTRFWQQAKVAKDESEQRNAWTQLVQVFGTRRAAWIAKQETTNDKDKLVDPKTAHTACTDLLPDYWVANGTISWKMRKEDPKEDPWGVPSPLTENGNPIQGGPIDPPLFVLPRFDRANTPQTLRKDPDTGWLFDFNMAMKKGMAFTIPIPPIPPGAIGYRINELLVYGVKASLKAEDAKLRLEKALEAHHYTQGLGFVAQGTPTNNTINASSGYNSEDVDSFEIERQQVAVTKKEAQPNYAVMEKALGINPTILLNVQDAITEEQRAARDMNDVIWEATWGTFLKEMLALKNSHQQDIDNKMKAHFVQYVRARGPLPALRIGTQPYGVLPVMTLGDGKNKTIPPDPVACLRALRGIWRRSLEHVPRLVRPKATDQQIDNAAQQKNNSDTLLQVLAMTPTGIDYVGRNCTRIVAASSSASTSSDGFAKTGRTPLLTELQTALDAMLGANTVTPHQRTVFTSPSGLFLLRSPLDEDDEFGANGHNFLFNLLTGSSDFAARELLLRETLDLCSHRLDAWITSLATKRLDELRTETPNGLFIGGYGWVENLEPDEKNKDTENEDPDAYIHAPSLAHATTAAILRSGYLTRRSPDSPQDSNPDSNALAINLTSDRIRLALHLVDGVRGGQSLGTLLGYRFERALHERSLDGFIPAFRKIAPGSTELITTANPNEKDKAKLENLVLDGLKLLQSSIDWNSSDFSTASAQNKSDMQSEVKRLGVAIDAVADLVLAESVHHVAQGNHVRAGATLEAIMRGETPPPEIEFVRTPRTGINHTHRISVIFGAVSTTVPWGAPTPRAQAEPILNAWAAQLLGPQAEEATCTVTYTDSSGAHTRPVSIKTLGLAPVDLVYMLDGELGGNDSEIEQRIVSYVQTQTPSAKGISLEFASSTGGTPPQLAEVLEVARTIRRLITGARALEPRDVVLPEQAVVDGTLPVDQSLVDRATTMRKTFGDAVQTLSDLVPKEQDSPLGNPQAVREALRGLAAYGLRGAIPIIPPHLLEKPDTALKQLHVQARAVLSEAQTRQTRAKAVPTSIQTTAQALSVFKAIFGEDFRVLPSFAPDNGKELNQTFQNPPIQQSDDPLPSITWFQRIARVREGAARLDTTMQYAEALTAPPLAFQIGQLPYVKDERWVALKNPPSGNRLSLTCMTMVTDFTKPLGGLLIDEWVETVPNKEEVTGLTFHYDAPQTRAPQALLLAVAPDGINQWNSTLLEQTLRETLELAKLRAVDLTALGELGQYLPAMYLDTSKFPSKGSS